MLITMECPWSTILKLVDEAAFVAATSMPAKTWCCSMDHIEFKHPVCVGDLLKLSAGIYYVSRTSMDVEVKSIRKNKEDRVVDIVLPV